MKREIKLAFVIPLVFLTISLFLNGMASAKDTRTVIAGKRYKASGFHQFWLGKDYRDLWTTPVELEVLDLQSYAGGLRPVMRVGDKQTLGLALKGADGRDYTFRGIDKDPAPLLPESFKGTLTARVVRDQTAAAHPAGAVIVPLLAEAIGVLHTEPKLVIMPDDALLGEFKQDFAGAVGTIEEYPQEGSELLENCYTASQVIGHEEMWEKLMAGPENLIDSRALLRARLLDFLIGDWDRHRDQWRWAKLPVYNTWQPIPEDRDQVFASYEGLLLSSVRAFLPMLVTFKDSYPKMEGFT